jgi:hypothetical protein
MAQTRHFEFFLLCYTTDRVTAESVNIGIVLFDPNSLAEGFCDARFLDDWERLQSIDPDADIEVLRATANDIQKQLRSTVQRESFLRMMEDSFSNAIWLSPRSECITEDPTLEIESLARRYLHPSSGDEGSSDLAISA